VFILAEQHDVDYEVMRANWVLYERSGILLSPKRAV
jgi:hypothetical protein